MQWCNCNTWCQDISCSMPRHDTRPRPKSFITASAPWRPHETVSQEHRLFKFSRSSRQHRMTMDESPTADIGTKPSSSARLDDWGCRAAAVFGKRRKKKRRKARRNMRCLFQNRFPVPGFPPGPLQHSDSSLIPDHFGSWQRQFQLEGSKRRSRSRRKHSYEYNYFHWFLDSVFFTCWSADHPAGAKGSSSLE